MDHRRGLLIRGTRSL